MGDLLEGRLTPLNSVVLHVCLPVRRRKLRLYGGYLRRTTAPPLAQLVR